MKEDAGEFSLDREGRHLEYVYRPAAAPGAPLLLMLHGHNKNPHASEVCVS